MRRQARLDTMPLNIFEQLTKLRPFVEVGSKSPVVMSSLDEKKESSPCVVVFQVVSDGLPLVQAVVPKNQTRSFIIQGSDILVRFSSTQSIKLNTAVTPITHLYKKLCVFCMMALISAQVTVSSNGLIGTHSWLPYDKNIANYFTFTKDPSMTNPKWVPSENIHSSEPHM